MGNVAVKEDKTAQILSIVNLIAAKHGMKVEVDFENYSINIVPIGDRDERAEVACAIELGEIFENYAEVE